MLNNDFDLYLGLNQSREGMVLIDVGNIAEEAPYMPRYHFNVYDGVNVLDGRGTLLPSMQKARESAVDMAGAIIGESAGSLEPGSEWHMDVTDPAGLVLYRLDFSVTEPGKNSTEGGSATGFQL